MLERFMEDDWVEAREVKELKTWLKSVEPDLNALGALKNYTLDFFRSKVEEYPDDKFGKEPVLRIVTGLNRILDALWRQSHADNRGEPHRESYHFGGPGGDLGAVLIRELEKANRSIDIAVFTITHDKISNTVIDRGRAAEGDFRVRIMTDDETLENRGSDIDRLSDTRDIHVRTDGGQSLMHHKFAIIDDSILINGSFNWTRSASYHNFENISVTTNPEVVAMFQKEFEQLWRGGHPLRRS